MELLERYLYAVRNYLPARQQNDIIRELRENILSQVEDRQLAEAGLEELLKQYGPPALLAQRYAPQRHLIGPGIFAAYANALKISLGTVVVICLLFPGIAAITGQHFEMNPIVSFIGIAMPTFVLMTLVFAGLDWVIVKYRLMEDWTRKWDPRTLPAISAGITVPPLSRRVTKLISSVALGIWWLLVLNRPFLMLGPVQSVFRLSPVWAFFYVPFLVLIVLDIVQKYLNLVAPQLGRAQTWLEMVRTGGAAVCLLLIVTFRLIEPLTPAAGNLAGIYNSCLAAGLAIGGVASLVRFIKTVRGTLRWKGAAAKTLMA